MAGPEKKKKEPEQAEKLSYERAKRAVMAMKGGIGTLFGFSTKKLEKPVGITQGTAAPLNGDVKKVATGASNAIKHGVTPQLKPSGPKQDGPAITAPKNKLP